MYRIALVLFFALSQFLSLKTEQVRGEDVPFVTRINLPALKARLENNRGKVIILDFWLHN